MVKTSVYIISIEKYC